MPQNVLDTDAVAPTAIPMTLDALTVDQRWAAWQAKGVRHDRNVQRKVKLAASVAAGLGLLALARLL